MDKFLILSLVCAVVGGTWGQQGYSTGYGNSQQSSSFFGETNSNFNPDVGVGGDIGDTSPQVFRHVWIHEAPADPNDQGGPRVIRVPGKKNTHVNLIFVKTSSSKEDSQQTELILPPPDEHKNLVYVLVRREDLAANLKVTRPPTPTGTKNKPEVYFIRYKDQGKYQGQDQGQGQVQGVGSSNLANFQQSRQRVTGGGGGGVGGGRSSGSGYGAPL